MKLKKALLLNLVLLFILQPINAQIIEGFTASKTEGCYPLQVDFSNKTKGATRYYWDLGNNNTSVLENPSAIYAAGEYFVKLVVWDKYGNPIGEFTQKIIAHNKPTIDFITKITEKCNESIVEYIPSSKVMNQYYWDFGDGSFHRAPSPVLVETSSGSKITSLKVVDQHGCEAHIAKNVAIDVIKPQAFEITAPLKQYVCEFPFQIDISCTNLGSGASYEWDFGDGQKLTSHQQKRNFITEGFHPIKVVATDNFGCTYSKSHRLEIFHIQNLKPSLDKMFLCEPGIVIGTGPTVNDAPAATSVSWDFGDGTPLVYGNKVSHEYSSPGKFKVYVGVIYGTRKCAFSHYMNVEVYDEQAPEIYTDVFQKTFCAPFEVELKDYNQNSENYWNIPDKIYSPDTTVFVNANEIAVTYPYGPNGQCKAIKVFTLENKSPQFIIDFIGESSLCTNRNYTLKSTQSNGSNCKYEWYVDKELVSTKSQTNYVFTSYGLHSVSFSATDSVGCVFWFDGQIIINRQPNTPNVLSDIHYKSCPPATCNFTIQNNDSIRVTAASWSFGDNENSTVFWPQHFYKKPGTFTVSVYVKYENGCTERIVIPDYITVGGPQGDFRISKKSGCPPLYTTYEASNFKHVKDFVIDFGDGGKRIGTKPESISYTYFNENTSYNPSIIISDSNGCSIDIQTPEIVVFPKVEIEGIEVTGPCTNDELQAKAKTIRSDASRLDYYWTFDTLVQTSVDFKNMHPAAGKHKIGVKIVNKYGCSDMLEKQIKVNHIEAQSDKMTDTACVGESLVFEHQSISDTSIIGCRWFVDNKLLSISPSFRQEYIKPGVSSLILVVTNAAGCTDSLKQDRAIFIGDTIIPKAVKMFLATSPTNEQNEVYFESVNGDDFRKYYIWQDAAIPLLIDSIAQNDVTRFTDVTEPKSSSRCYKIEAQNLCGLRTEYEDLEKHCTIYLETKPDTNRVDLSWNNYVGRGDLSSYRVLRKEGKEDFKILGMVEKGTFCFIDSTTVCHKEYRYKVEALFLDTLISESNSRVESPPFKNAIPKLYPFLVSINDNKQIEFSYSAFNPRLTSIIDSVYFQISSKDGFSVTDQKHLKTDSNFSYHIGNSKTIYSITSAFKNECGEYSDKTEVCNTILLSVAINKENRPKLEWNKYNYWPNGEESYIVQRKISNGEFEDIGVTHETQFEDYNVPQVCMNSLQYRIKAVANAAKVGYFYIGNTTASFSNIDDVAPKPLVYIPNAFTPNGNELNETFGPVTTYYKSICFEIYNRYGEKLWLQNQSCQANWDGMYNGQEVPQGVYMYLLKVRGLSNKEFIYKGTVHVIK